MAREIKINTKHLQALGLVVALFAVAGLITAVMTDHNDTIGGRVAEAASQVNHQVDDTRQEFGEINEMALEAAPVQQTVELMSGGGEANRPAPRVARGGDHVENEDGEGGRFSLGSIRKWFDGAINPDDAANGVVAEPEPEVTINEKIREVQGDDLPLTVHQVNADRLVENWKPQFRAAEREHEALSIRIESTRELWPEYVETQNEYIELVSNADLRESMRNDLRNDQEAFSTWDRKATEVQSQSDQAMTTLRDMDYMIEFQRNRADLRAVIGQESLEIAGEITTLLESLDQFEAHTDALSNAISQ